MKWVNRQKLVLMWKIIFMEECASILHATSDKKKAGLLLWFVNLFWSIFSFSSQTFCFFWRPSAFLGFFGLWKAWRAFSGQKIPKRPQASRKKQNVFKLQLKILQKKVDSSWKNACFLFIFGPISYWRAFFHDTIPFGILKTNEIILTKKSAIVS